MNDRQRFIDRLRRDAGCTAAERALSLLVEYLPLAMQIVGRPAETRSLRAMAFGEQSLNLGAVGKQTRGLSFRLFDGDQHGADVTDERRDVVGEL